MYRSLINYPQKKLQKISQTLSFRHKYKSDKDRELLVFITPRIVKAGCVDLVKFTGPVDYNDILSQREQSGYQYRKEEIDKVLSNWDNR